MWEHNTFPVYFKETKFEEIDLTSQNSIDKLGMLAPPDDDDEMDFLNGEILNNRNSSINDWAEEVKSVLNSSDNQILG